MKGDKLTAKQEAFCIGLEIEKLTQRQAYIKAFNPKTSTNKSIDELSSRMAKNVKIQSRREELRDKVEKEAIWSKIEMLRDLKKIKDEAIGFSTTNENGEVMKIDASLRSVAIKAIERASKMLGYDEAEKVDNVVRIMIDSDIDELSE